MKIKNRSIRRLLRMIANWDKCPTDYCRNWKNEIAKGAIIIFTAFSMVYFFLFVLAVFS